MLRKLFWLIMIGCVYIWFSKTDDTSLKDKITYAYEYSLKWLEENEVELHIHTPGCFHR